MEEARTPPAVVYLHILRSSVDQGCLILNPEIIVSSPCTEESSRNNSRWSEVGLLSKSWRKFGGVCVEEPQTLRRRFVTGLAVPYTAVTYTQFLSRPDPWRLCATSQSCLVKTSFNILEDRSPDPVNRDLWSQKVDSRLRHLVQRLLR